MRIFFDTETTDYWEFRRPPTDPSQPMLLQLAAVLEDGAGRTVAAVSAILRQDAWPCDDDVARLRRRVRVSERATAVHGITDSMVDSYGQSPDLVLAQLRRMFGAAEECVAHNIEFDVGVLRNTCRVLHVPELDLPRERCTMRESTDMVRAVSYMGTRKWPKLAEAYQHFQRRPMTSAHDALADVYACRAVFRGVERQLAAERETAAAAPERPAAGAPSPGAAPGVG